MSGFVLTYRQQEAQRMLAGSATHEMLFGGSRSGKTFLLTRAVATRAIKAPESRHAILRLRFNHVKASIVLDTFPKMMKLCFPDVRYTIDKSDWYATLHSNDSQIWFGGLDEKQRTEKILGQEHATIYLNECSQIPFSAREIAVTRLAQRIECKVEGMLPSLLKPRMFYDCNPPKKSHWTYKMFKEKRDPVSGAPLNNPDDYVCMQINPKDNQQNLAPGYLETLMSLSKEKQRRFLDGEFTDDVANGLFSLDSIEAYRAVNSKLPDMVRIVVGVDPSGAGDEDNAHNDAIGIVVGGLGVDGNAYLLEDCTVKAGPAVWGKVATSAFDRHKGDVIVGEVNFGGAMVGFVIQTARPRTAYKNVTASRGKVVRAEPFSALYEQGKIRHAGYFTELEDEIVNFTTLGYMGTDSPNRADAWFWVLAELFPGMVNETTTRVEAKNLAALLSQGGGITWG